MNNSDVVEQEVREEKMFNELDPDMSTEDIKKLGYVVKYESTYGEQDVDVTNIREGLGHSVMNEN